MNTENRLRDEIAKLGRSLFERGLTSGSTGNLSARLDDGGYLVTPTDTSLGFLDPARLSRLDSQGNWIDGDKPTKEGFLHLSMYRVDGDRRAVAHLHSTYSVCLSCLRDLDADDMLPPITPYVLMKVGRVARVPFFPPGDEALGPVIEEKARTHSGIIIANHGPVVAARSLRAAVFGIEEVEESAKLAFLLRNEDVEFIPEDYRQTLLKSGK
ncbi:MAG: aldolase [Gammaproteobacteria bacterium]|nr:aldolase [Gammaproteobacteria bacterium]